MYFHPRAEFYDHFYSIPSPIPLATFFPLISMPPIWDPNLTPPYLSDIPPFFQYLCGPTPALTQLDHAGFTRDIAAGNMIACITMGQVLTAGY
jgi:hypothetical protein